MLSILGVLVSIPKHYLPRLKASYLILIKSDMQRNFLNNYFNKVISQSKRYCRTDDILHLSIHPADFVTLLSAPFCHPQLGSKINKLGFQMDREPRHSQTLFLSARLGRNLE